MTNSTDRELSEILSKIYASVWQEKVEPFKGDSPDDMGGIVNRVQIEGIDEASAALAALITKREQQARADERKLMLATMDELMNGIVAKIERRW